MEPLEIKNWNIKSNFNTQNGNGQTQNNNYNYNRQNQNPNNYNKNSNHYNNRNFNNNRFRHPYHPKPNQQHSYGQQQQQQQQRKRPTFHCEPCSRSFFSENDLNEHNAEHIVCKLDGCKYTAHFKLVMKHIELQHSNGLFLKIKGYDTPEDIEKWKAERRKKFPTLEKVQKEKEEKKDTQKNKTNYQSRPRQNRDHYNGGKNSFRNNGQMDSSRKFKIKKVNNFSSNMNKPEINRQFVNRNNRDNSANINKTNPINKLVYLESFYSNVIFCPKKEILKGTKEIAWDINFAKKISKFEHGEKNESDDTSSSSDEIGNYGISDDEEDEYSNTINDTDKKEEEKLSQNNKLEIENSSSSEDTANKIQDFSQKSQNPVLEVSTEKPNGLASLLGYGSCSDSDLEDGEIS